MEGSESPQRIERSEAVERLNDLNFFTPFESMQPRRVIH
jgi:hypothetical protein